MDPNAALKEIRELVQKLDRDEDQFSHNLDAMRLCELVDGLDQWMTRGGFPPGDWTPEIGIYT